MVGAVARGEAFAIATAVAVRQERTEVLAYPLITRKDPICLFLLKA